MPVVTAIKRQLRGGLATFEIMVDGEYGFTLTDLDLSLSGLRVGHELSISDVEQYLKKAKQDQAYGLALRFLGVRARSKREVEQYLVRKGCSLAESEEAMIKLEALGLVDDEKFAQAWVADRVALRPRSQVRLAQELYAKGVSKEISAIALSKLMPGQEVDQLKTIIARKRRSSSAADDKKLIAYLQRQGYRWDQIKQAMAGLEDVD